MSRTDVFIVAAEPSGDRLGAALAQSLIKFRPEIRLAGIGGPDMERAGLPSRMDIDGLAILGFVEGLKAYGHVLRKVRQATESIMNSNPEAVVLIDSWGFMMRVAKRLRRQGYAGRIVKYVAPQVWATRPGRARILASHVDHLLSTQTMDTPHFEPLDLPLTFVGNPVLDTDYGAGDAEAFRSRHELSAARPIVGLFPGSRPAEVDRVGPAILGALRTARAAIPALQPVCIVAEVVTTQVRALFAGEAVTLIDQTEFIDALSAMDAALACSGTVTTQLAAAGVPTVVLYRLSPLTFAIASRMFRPRFISLVNISADSAGAGSEAPLLQEFMQDDIDSDAPADALIELLENADLSKRLSDRLMQETRRMSAGPEHASDKAAKAVLSLIGQRLPIGT
ncbi:lipid-A-disaccharide synthase [uncultured Algimonas sp.]|uniref:lipid-A-disaccharide synthase n=1 Tax=uncultured Algimonas sp. TaxID=1547920 RepID=UPI002615A140|nr:lipid-A-disaccharide synthase [uncultured Algimonas sp.]